MIHMNDIITTAPKLWKEIAGTAQFQHKEYDKDMLQEIRNTLALPSGGNMGNLLKTHQVSCEALLSAVLQCMLPFAQMLNDLLVMFQQAGAQQTNHNLKIQFDFNSRKEKFSTDLEFFRQQTVSANTAISCVTAQIPVRPYELVEDIKGIWQPDYMNDPSVLHPEQITHWLTKYRQSPFGTWPDYTPEKPSTGFVDLDAQIGKLWNILHASLWKCRTEYSEEREQMIRGAKDEQFWWCERDRWIGALAESVYNLLTYFQTHRTETHSDFAADVAEKIDLILQKTPTFQISVKETYQAVQDILNLPFWKKRYELYSAWVCTRILDAMSDPNIRFHVKDNTLSFSFGGSHIATLPSYAPPLELWAEARTYYGSPKGDSRRGHIQPDYTLAISNAYNPNQSVAVVECKQYKKYSRKNFLNAAEDYAGGRPHASVFLVNYGKISDTLIDDPNLKYRDRIQFHGLIRPGKTETKTFQNALKDAVDRFYINSYKVRLPEYYLPSGYCSICLRWDAEPADLDLHLVVANTNETYHISHKQMGENDTPPFAVLRSDEQRGYGPERIVIHKWIPAQYDIYVHDFRDSETISGPITVQIEIDGQVMFALSRTEPIKRGQVWHPYTIAAGRLIPVNDTVDFSGIDKS